MCDKIKASVCDKGEHGVFVLIPLDEAFVEKVYRSNEDYNCPFSRYKDKNVFVNKVTSAVKGVVLALTEENFRRYVSFSNLDITQKGLYSDENIVLFHDFRFRLKEIFNHNDLEFKEGLSRFLHHIVPTIERELMSVLKNNHDVETSTKLFKRGKVFTSKEAIALATEWKYRVFSTTLFDFNSIAIRNFIISNTEADKGNRKGKEVVYFSWVRDSDGTCPPYYLRQVLKELEILTVAVGKGYNMESSASDFIGEIILPLRKTGINLNSVASFNAITSALNYHKATLG